MCKDCGCDTKTGNNVIDVNSSITAVNDAIAKQIFSYLKEKNILCVNIMGSPGSGKTTVIEQLTNYLNSDKLFVIQGDLESDVDKVRLEKVGIETYQINTHSGCHLNASMINKALLESTIKDKEFLFIENVGNLVCPVGVKVGQHTNMVVSSTTEGSDKPKKYPHIFIDTNLIVISKFDIASAVDFDEESYLSDLKKINGKAKIIKTSSKDKDSFKELAYVLKHKRDHLMGKKHSH